MADFAHLDVRQHGDVWLAKPLYPQLTGDLPGKVGEELLALAAQPDCLKLLVNLSCVTQMSSEMFGKLLMLSRCMGQKKGRLKLCEVFPDIRQILIDTRLERVFDIQDTETAALAAFE
jgi:anti-sigma B factor antagonist